MTDLVSIEDLRTEIKLRRSVVHAIDGVSLSVAAGEIELAIAVQIGERRRGQPVDTATIRGMLEPPERIVKYSPP